MANRVSLRWVLHLPDRANSSQNKVVSKLVRAPWTLLALIGDAPGMVWVNLDSVWNGLRALLIKFCMVIFLSIYYLF